MEGNRLPGLCEDADPTQWIKAKHSRYVLASFEGDAKAIQKVLMKHNTLFTLLAYFDFLADHRIVNVLHKYLRSSADTIAGEDGLANIRPLDELIAAVKVIFQDRCAMVKCFFGEMRRWQGRQLLNQVFFERTGNVKWMPETSDAAPRQPLQTFFHTVQVTSSFSTEPMPSFSIRASKIPSKLL